MISRHILVNNFLEYSSDKFPDKVAVVCEGERLTYGYINEMANRLATTLKDQGIERGDRVAIFMDNSIEAVVSIFAVLKAGAVFMVINHTTKSGKLNYIINDSGARAMLTQGSRMKAVECIDSPYLKTVIAAGSYDGSFPFISYEDIMYLGDSRPVFPEFTDLDIASIIYTSGSTGVPKGVMLSHLNMVSAAHSITTYLENTENDIIINVLPLSFDYGLYQILMAFKMGCTVVLEKSFMYPYRILETMIREKVTGFPGVPTIFAMILKMKDINKYDFSSLRYVTNTAAALPVNHIQKVRELFSKAKIFSMYGLTECKRVSYLPPEDLETRPDSVGKGMPNQETYIINDAGEEAGDNEIGELVVRGANVMLGYWNMPDETSRCLRPWKNSGERVLYTGDLFRKDKEGYLYFVARMDDIIKCKGEKVSPREIENTLCNLDEINEAAVIGVPDEIFGQAIHVFVSLKKGSELTEKKILKYCSQNLENIMIPKYVDIVQSLPKTASGKIERKSLKKRHSSV